MKLSQTANTQRICVYGPPKSGKSELTGKLAEKFKLVWFNLDFGNAVLRKLPLAWQENIDCIDIPDTKVWPIAVETMLKVITGAPLEICTVHGKVTCGECIKNKAPVNKVCLNDLRGKADSIVVVDNGTQLATSAINWLERSKDDDYQETLHDFRNQGKIMDKFLSQMEKSNINFVFITHVIDTEKNEKLPADWYPISGTRNFSKNTGKYFDSVVYCEVKNTKHVFSSKSGAVMGALTGSRTDIDIATMKTPSLLPFFDAAVIQQNMLKAQAENSTAAAQMLAGVAKMAAAPITGVVK